MEIVNSAYNDFAARIETGVFELITIISSSVKIIPSPASIVIFNSFSIPNRIIMSFEHIFSHSVQYFTADVITRSISRSSFISKSFM